MKNRRVAHVCGILGGLTVEDGIVPKCKVIRNRNFLRFRHPERFRMVYTLRMYLYIMISAHCYAHIIKKFPNKKVQ